jgi:hypothetical protein
VGVGAVNLRLLFTLFQRDTGTQLTLVPYRGTAPTMQDLVAGQIDLSFNSADQLPLARAESIKAFAVTGDTRLVLAPDIPSFAELGLSARSYSGWYGLFAPRGTPAASSASSMKPPRWHWPIRWRELVSPISECEVFPPEQQTPETLAGLVKAGAEKWLSIIKELEMTKRFQHEVRL